MVHLEVPKCSECCNDCFGDVVSTRGGKYFHQDCFSCCVTGCEQSLLKSGYFHHDGQYYCRNDYHKLLGNQCKVCRKYVEGETISAISALYHPECFACERCKNPFRANVEICFDGKGLYCAPCYSHPNQTKLVTNHTSNTNGNTYNVKTAKKNTENITKQGSTTNNTPAKPAVCAGCDNEIKTDQSLLLALEKQWHLWCFNCSKCGMLLAGDYMVRDGMPFCEQDYQAEFGVSCASCGGYITGKVLQAGDKHYHPSCSHCAKCGRMFGEGEEMYLQGTEIWHPECCEELQEQVEESDVTRDSEFDITPIDYGDFSFSLNDSADSFRHFIEQEEAQEVVSPHKLRNGDILASSTHSVSKTHSRPTVKKSAVRTPNPSPHQTYYSSLPEKKSAVKEKGYGNNHKKDNEKDHEKDYAPPVPPPPTRSSSKLFLQKYNSGVYGATPFQRGSTERLDAAPQTRNGNHAPHRRSQNGISYDDQISVKSRPLSSSTPTLHQEDHDTSSASSSGDSQNGGKYQKGIGYNKLQRRRSLREEKTMKLPTNVDPERLHQFLEDPNHNVYLDDREFYQIFKITRERFYALPQTKKEEMKREALKTFYVSSN